MAYFDGDDGKNKYTGTRYDDEIYGNGGDDELHGGRGIDFVIGGDGKDKLWGDEGDDQLFGEAGDDTLEGGSGADSLDGGSGKDKLRGGAGDDAFQIISLADGNGDEIDGGSGIDVLNLRFTNESKKISFSAADPIKSVTLEGMKITGIERYSIFGGKGDDTLTGYLLDDQLYGGGGKDRLDGNGGDDMIAGDDGDDTLFGGRGDDYLDGGTGRDALDGGRGDDYLTGSLGRDTLKGGDGNDVLISGSDIFAFDDDDRETDRLEGGNGDDELTAGIDDEAIGGSGTDNVSLLLTYSDKGETFTFGTGKVNLASGGYFDQCETLSFLGGTKTDKVTGGDGDDDLSGGAGNDELAGGKGFDILSGDAGNDTLRGGDGTDVLYDFDGTNKLYGDRGDDYLYIYEGIGTGSLYDGGKEKDVAEFTGGMGVYLDLGNQSKNEGLAFGATFTNIEIFIGSEADDTLLGSRDKDTLIGGDSDDVIKGNSGDDVIQGGLGSDTLSGGDGKDVIILAEYDYEDDWDYFGSVLELREQRVTTLEDEDEDGDDYGFGGLTGWQGDVVTDFKRGEDKLGIAIDNYGWAKESNFKLVVNSTGFADGSGSQLIFDKATSRLWWDYDGKGDDYDPLLIATLNGVKDLSSSDFKFVSLDVSTLYYG
jgi:Ca2+-binding RTX toxin-like protein